MKISSVLASSAFFLSSFAMAANPQSQKQVKVAQTDKAQTVATPTTRTENICINGAAKDDVLRVGFGNSVGAGEKQISCSCKIMAGNSVYQWVSVSCKGWSAKDCETCCKHSLAGAIIDSKED